MSRANLEQAYKLAEEIMKERATSFYQAFKHLPAERFRSVSALYAFCRHADDTVDIKPQQRGKQATLALLDSLERQLRLLYSSDYAEDKLFSGSFPWWPAFADTVTRFDVPIDSFLQQLEGQRQDIDFADIETTDQLVEYCRLVAGSVGTMMLPILAADDADTNNPGLVIACESLGIAMQITNILRDVGEDLRTRNRLYLPRDLLEQHGVKRHTLEKLAHYKGDSVKELIPKGFVTLWEKLANMADEYYKSYERWLGCFHPSTRLPLVAAALSYRAIADEVRKEQYNCFTKRCYTSSETRAQIANQAKQLLGL